MKVGDRFVLTQAQPYDRWPTPPGVHAFTDLIEVTEVTELGLSYAIVSRVSESGRWPYDRTPTPTGGSLSWRDWDAALSDDRVSLELTSH